MTSLLLALVLALPAGAAPRVKAAKAPSYGILILAYGVGGSWRKDLGALRSRLKGHAVESVERIEGSPDGVGVQRALDKLLNQHVDKVVAVPLAALSESPAVDEARYLFGIREEPVTDRPDAREKEMPGPRAAVKSALVLPADGRRLKRLTSRVPLVLAATIDRSQVLAEILADRAKALSRDPARDAVVLAGVGPRSDAALTSWKAAASAVAEQVRQKGGFRKAAAVAVRGGVRAGQRDKDREELRTTLRALTSEGRVVIVPLAPDGSLVERMLKRDLGNAAYHWDGKGLLGDRRLLDWVGSAAEAASKLPDARRYKDGAPGAPPGGWR